MSYAKKSQAKVAGLIISVVAIVGLAMWQFYLFVTFKNAQGIVDTQGGTHHLWWAISMAVFACITGFFVFTVFVQHDHNDDLHITGRRR